MQHIKTNYHTHHELCGHAQGRAKDYAVAAIKEGFEVLGISDHAPSKLHYNPRVRMPWSAFEAYLKDIESAQQRYGSQITILKGLETEFTEDDPAYYRELLDKVDYMILAQHYVPWKNGKKPFKSVFNLKTEEHIKAYGKYIVEGIKSGYYVAVAHPDVYMSAYPAFDQTAEQVAHDIIDTAIEYDIPLEINAQGIRKGLIKTNDGLHYRYPRKEFFRIAKAKGARIMVGSDAHTPDSLNDESFQAALAFADALDITLIERLDINP